MPTTLDEFYNKLDALNVNDEQACLEFAKYSASTLLPKIDKISLTIEDLEKAGILKPGESFEDAMNNKEVKDSIFFIKIQNFLNFSKVRIDRVEKLAKIENIITSEKNAGKQELALCQKVFRPLFSYAHALEREESLENEIIQAAKNELRTQSQDHIVMILDNDSAAMQLSNQLRDELSELSQTLPREKAKLIKQLSDELNEQLNTEENPENIIILKKALNLVEQGRSLDEMHNDLDKLPKQAIKDTNKLLSQCMTKISRTNAALNKLSIGEKILDNQLYILGSDNISQLNSSLNALLEKSRIIDSSLNKLESGDYQKSSCLKAFLCPDIVSNPNTYHLQDEYILGKYLVLSEWQERLTDVISEVNKLTEKLDPPSKKNFEMALTKLEESLAMASTIDARNLILNQAKQIKQSAQFASFRAEIRIAKGHVKDLPQKQQEKGHQYLQSLVDCFHDEKSFEKRGVVLDVAIKTNKYLSADPDQKTDAKNKLRTTANQLEHVAHGKKAIGRLMMFVGTVALVAGAVTALTGGGALLAAAGAGMIAAGKLTVVESKNTMAKPAQQAFFQPPASAQKSTVPPDAPEDPKNDLPRNMGYGKR